MAKANAEAIMAVYHSNTEASYAQAKEVIDTAQIRAYWAAELSKIHSLRETLKEIHARCFDLAIDIKDAKELEVNDNALVFCDDDDSRSMSGSEIGE